MAADVVAPDPYPAGTSTDTSSAYVYAPAQFVVVDRMDAEILLDRSRLFHKDMSEIDRKSVV